MTPPAALYHGTSERILVTIMREGLRKMRRHHVHLSADVATARDVGARHGPPVVLVVDAASIQAAGSIFRRSANGVWLVEHVPPVRSLPMPDHHIECATCRRSFTWTAGEQQFYRERGLQTPRHCPTCREARRTQTVAPPSNPRSTAAPARPTAGPARPKPGTRPIARRSSPRRTFGMTALVAAIILSVVVFVVAPATPLLAWLVAVNAVTLLAYGYDKGIAGGHRTRIPEAVLLGLALIGGTLGAFAGMVLFHHKTSKPAFLVPFALIVVFQLALAGAWLTLGQGG